MTNDIDIGEANEKATMVDEHAAEDKGLDYVLRPVRLGLFCWMVVRDDRSHLVFDELDETKEELSRDSGEYADDRADEQGQHRPLPVTLAFEIAAFALFRLVLFALVVSADGPSSLRVTAAYDGVTAHDRESVEETRLHESAVTARRRGIRHGGAHALANLMIRKRHKRPELIYVRIGEHVCRADGIAASQGAGNVIEGHIGSINHRVTFLLCITRQILPATFATDRKGDEK